MRVLLWTTYAKDVVANRLRRIPGCELVVIEDYDHFAREVGTADILACPEFIYNAKVAAAVLQQAKQLKFIQLFTAGYENVLKNGRPDGVILSNSGDASSRPVATHAVGLLMALQRGIPHALASQAKHDWNRAAMAFQPIDETNIGIVGMGNIGRNVAAMVRAFGAFTIGISRKPQPHPLLNDSVALKDIKSVLPTLDALVLSLPLTPETHHLIDRDALALFKPSALIVNIARGGLIDSNALADALKSGKIAGAGLDVTEPEPLPPEHPLWDAPNLIITPHISASTGTETFEKLVRNVGGNVERFIRGQQVGFLVEG